VIAGLGGRHHQGLAAQAVRQAEADALESLTFLDLDWDIVNRVLEREKQNAARADRRRHPARLGGSGTHNV